MAVIHCNTKSCLLQVLTRRNTSSYSKFDLSVSEFRLHKLVVVCSKTELEK